MENLQQNSNIPQPIVEDDEIDLIALAKTLWNGRKIVILSVIVCAVIGLTVALLSPKEYTASTIVVPQVGKSSSKLGGLSSLAAMAGFNLDNMGSGSEALSPMVYPQIVNSVPFQLELMNTPFTFTEVDHPISIFEYYTKVAKPGILSRIKKYTIGLPSVIMGTIIKPEKNLSRASNNVISLTEQQEAIRKMLSAKVHLGVNSKEGYITITANLAEAVLSAEVAQFSRELLQKTITQFKIKKANEQLEFIRARFLEKKNEFEIVQENLARFRDRNKNVSLAIAKTEEERLQSEYSIALNVYTELAKQLEQALIQVKEETPVFTIIEPVSVPLIRSSPKKVRILIMWLFIGGVAGIGIVFLKQYLAVIREKWN